MMPDHTYTQTEHLTILTHGEPGAVKQLAEGVIPQLGEITVIKNQVGLVMLPYTDSAEGTVFHLGEVLVTEAHIRCAGAAEGYGMVLGRDVEWAMAVAVLDAALTANIAVDVIYALLDAQAAAQAAADDDMLRKVEVTRIHMETF